MANEDPGIVFSVKELIGRLDGKLDMVLNVLTNKADRADVSALDRRLGVVEDNISAINTHTQERERAAQERKQLHEKAKADADELERKRRERRQFFIGTIIAVIVAACAVITILIQGGGHP